MKFSDILTSSAHAYIVEGKGALRQDFVRKFIEALNCTSMDIVYMEKSGKTGYMVKDASAMISRLSMGAYGKHVVGVIEDADTLSETLQNKLLKTLEEPEPGVVIILATNNADNLLSTVRSRCSLLRVSEFSEAALEEADDENIKLSEVRNYLLEIHNFHEYREVIDKKIKTQEDAIIVLGQLEDSFHERMINETNRAEMARAIELIETARMDIYSGMHYGKALKRLCLELS